MTQTVSIPGVGSIDFPDGMSQQEMTAAIQKNFPQIHNPAQTKQPGFVGKDGNYSPLNAVVKEAQTPSFGESLAIPVGAALSDTGRSIAHLARLVAAGPFGAPAASMANAADQANIDANEQPARDTAAAANPKTYYGFYVPTSIFSMAPMGEGIGQAARAGIEALPAATSALGKAALWAAPKAAQGAAYGVQTPGDVETNAAAGAALGPLADLAGTGLGLAARGVAKGGSSAVDFGSKLFQPDASAQKTVQRIIDASRLGGGAQAPAIPGVALTQGGATLDPGIQSLEQAVRMRVAGGAPNEAMFQAQQRANNDAVHAAVNGIEDATATPDKTSAAAQAALQNARDTLSDRESELWKQIPMGTKVDAANTAAAIDGYINKQSITNQRTIRKAAGDFLDDFKATVSKYADEADGDTQVKMPFGEVKDLRSTLGEAIREAQKNGRSNTVRLLKGMDERLLSSLGDENALLGVPNTGNATLDSALTKLGKMNGTVTGQQLGDAYNAARGFTADIHNKYFPKDVQGLLDHDPSKMLDAATRTPDNLSGFLNAASQAPDKGAAATQAVRQYLLNKAMNSSSMSARGGVKKFVNGQDLGDFLTKNRAVLGQVFSADELKTLGAAAQNAYRNIATESANPKLGSTTINNIFKNNAISAQMVPGVDGANQLAVKAAATGINKLLGKYSGKTETYLRDALLDPANNKGLYQPPPIAGTSLIDLLSQGAAKLPQPLQSSPKAALIRYLLQQQSQQQPEAGVPGYR